MRNHQTRVYERQASTLRKELKAAKGTREAAAISAELRSLKQAVRSNDRAPDLRRAPAYQ